MHRSHIALLLCAVMLLGLCACGGQGNTPEAAPPAQDAETPLDLPADSSYADAYMQYMAVYGALIDEVARRLDTHNAILESRFPDSYYMDSDYLMLVYAPFNTVYPSLGSGLTGEDTSSAATLLRQSFPDAEVAMTAPGRWEATYDYIDNSSDTELRLQGRCVWECDGQTGSLRVRAYVDGTLIEFTEFVPQGDDLYALYTMTDLALIRYTAAGGITELTHVHRICEYPMGAFRGDMRTYDLEQRELFPRGALTRDVLTGDGDAQYLLTLEGDTMTYRGKISQDILDQEGSKVSVTWQTIEPIVFLK